MAMRRGSKISMWDSIGRKVQNGVELFGKAKGAYEAGRALYTGFQTVYPYLETAATLLV